jgi:hypothetical protein
VARENCEEKERDVRGSGNKTWRFVLVLRFSNPCFAFCFFFLTVFSFLIRFACFFVFFIMCTTTDDDR